MTLDPLSMRRLEYLLGKQRAVGLNHTEELELRGIVARENPSAKNQDLDDLIKLGLIIVGAYLLLRALSE